MTPTCKLCDDSRWLIPERLEGGPYRCLCGREQAEEIERLNGENAAMRRSLEGDGQVYEGTRQDWIDRAFHAESIVETLRAELEQARIERDRETEVRRAAEKHVRDLQAYLDRVGYPDEWDQLQERAEQAERVLEQILHIAINHDPTDAVAEIIDIALRKDQP